MHFEHYHGVNQYLTFTHQLDMGILGRLKAKCLPKKQHRKQEDDSVGTISRTSTIVSQTMDLVYQQSMLQTGSSGDVKTGSGRAMQPTANWESIQYPNGSEYLGWTFEGMREGPGKIENGNLMYDGQWQNDIPHGNGVFCGEGIVYEGNWDHGLPHGNGVAMLPNNSKYAGEWRDGACNGIGKLMAAGGHVYAGKFADGLPNGEGVMVTADGVRIICNFMDGVPYGVGTIEWPNGMMYVGTIIEGLPHGFGRMNNDEYVTLGLWKKGVLETRLQAHSSIPDAIRDDPAVKYILRHQPLT